jgi:hypothetical protein
MTPATMLTRITLNDKIYGTNVDLENAKDFYKYI